MKANTNEILEATQKMSSSSSRKGNSVEEDAVITPALVYKQLLQVYAEEHVIQDLLFYLVDELRRKSIGLDTYIKICFFLFNYNLIFLFSNTSENFFDDNLF
ncbi:unnamed protein product [Rotaria sp. Silwood1]|nr:unnamed protein product [Rotaria sp. Silwood1]